MANIEGEQRQEVLHKLLQLSAREQDEIEEALSRWEIDFLDSILDRYNTWGSSLFISEKQAEKIDLIYTKLGEHNV